jgi:hypothetical protein
MLRRISISARLNLLISAFSLALIAVVVIAFFSLNSESHGRDDLVQVTNERSVARTLQFDFANFNGLQKAVALQVGRKGVAEAADTATTRKAFLDSIVQTRADLAKLRTLSQEEGGVDESDVAAVATSLDQFIQVDAQIMAQYRRGDLASKARGDALVLSQETEIFSAATASLNTVVDGLTRQVTNTVKAAALCGRLPVSVAVIRWSWRAGARPGASCTNCSKSSTKAKRPCSCWPRSRA